MTELTANRRPLSCAWAMEAALQLRGVVSVTRTLLFGLGGGAWCGISLGADGNLRLQGLHTDRIKLAFYALNVWSVCFRYLSPDAVFQLRERCDQGLQTLLTIDRAVANGAPIVADEAAEYTVLVTGLRREGGCEFVQLRSTHAPDGVELPLQTLQQAWFCHGPDGPVATFYWHPLIQLRWDPSIAVARSLRRFVHRMEVQYPGNAPNGLAALEYLATVTAEVMRQSARRLRDNGGTCFYRDHMAEFLRAAAPLTGQPELLDCASRYECAAALWQELLEFWVEAPAGAINGALIADIAAIERVALSELQRACAMQPLVAHA